MTEALLVGTGILLAAMAQVALKWAATSLTLSGLTLAGVFYLAAFGVYFHLLRTLPLSWLSPLMVGGVTLLVVLAGMAMGEPVGMMRWLGVGFLLVGLGLVAVGR